MLEVKAARHLRFYVHENDSANKNGTVV
jgi:hypothetical protein